MVTMRSPDRDKSNSDKTAEKAVAVCLLVCVKKRPAKQAIRKFNRMYYSNSFHERPSRVIIATEATGPQVPA